MTKNTKVAGDKSETVAQLPLACSDETSAVEFIEHQLGLHAHLRELL